MPSRISDNTSSGPASTAASRPPVGRDVPCRHCGYNLRGLTVNRCPECGGEFTEEDLLPHVPMSEGASRMPWVAMAIIGILFLILIAPPLALALPAILAVMLALALAQAAIEFPIAGRLVGPWGIDRPFVLWIAGVVVTFGGCSFSLMLFDRCLSYFDPRPPSPFPIRLWPLLAMNYAVAVSLQWFVIWWKTRKLDDGPSSAELLIACLAAKAVSSALWMFAPCQLVRVP